MSEVRPWTHVDRIPAFNGMLVGVLVAGFPLWLLHASLTGETASRDAQTIASLRAQVVTLESCPGERDAAYEQGFRDADRLCVIDVGERLDLISHRLADIDAQLRDALPGEPEKDRTTCETEDGP